MINLLSDIQVLDISAFFSANLCFYPAHQLRLYCGGAPTAPTHFAGCLIQIHNYMDNKLGNLNPHPRTSCKNELLIFLKIKLDIRHEALF